MEQENKEGRLIDSMVSSLKIQETLNKKLARRIRLMPEIKKNYDFVAKDETSAEANYFCDGFVEGAEWRINSVWHNITEEPKPGSWIAILTCAVYIKSVYSYKDICRYMSIIEAKGWAYIEDLIPDKEK